MPWLARSIAAPPALLVIWHAIKDNEAINLFLSIGRWAVNGADTAGIMHDGAQAAQAATTVIGWPAFSKDTPTTQECHREGLDCRLVCAAVGASCLCALMVAAALGKYSRRVGDRRDSMDVQRVAFAALSHQRLSASQRTFFGNVAEGGLQHLTVLAADANSTPEQLLVDALLAETSRLGPSMSY